MRTKPIAGQEAIFLVSPETGAPILPDQPAAEEVAVSIVDRDIHLLASLAILGETSQYKGFERAVRSPARRRAIADTYGDKTIDAINEGAQRNAETARKQSKWEFARASGMFTLIDSGTLEAPDAKRRTSNLFNRFEERFGGARNAGERNRYQRQLNANLRKIQRGVTDANRESGLRPHKVTKKEVLAPDEKQLNIRERLTAIHEDPRAGFYPTTHREKNTVLAFLDYLDNPANPLGANNQRLEIFNHQERLKDKGLVEVGGERSIESLTYELVDYFLDARKQLVALQDLETYVAEMMNPSVTLADELPQGHVGLLALVRYKDIAAYASAQKRRKTQFIDPLTTKEDRWAKSNDPGKHKTVHDQYTLPKDDTDQAVLDMAAGSMTVLEARPLLRVAITDQLKRMDFLGLRVQEVARLKPRTFANSRELAKITLKSFDIQYLDAA